MTAQEFPFHSMKSEALEKISEPLYSTATYPKGGVSSLSFSFCSPTDLNVSNIRNGALSEPQRFEMIGLTMRPVPGLLCPEHALQRYLRLRILGTYKFYIGMKPYSCGPLDHILDCSDLPSAAIRIGERFWPVTVMDKSGNLFPLYIPSLQQFSLEARWEHPYEAPCDLPLRLYVVGSRFREVC